MATARNYSTMLSTAQTLLILIIIFFSALAWAVAHPTPRSAPALAMRRESKPLYWTEALDISLNRGYRAVNWNQVIWPETA